MILTDSFKGMVQMYQNPDHEPGKPEETRLIEAMRLAGSNADELAAMVEMLGLIVDSSLLPMTRAEDAQAKANQARELMKAKLALAQKDLENAFVPDDLIPYLKETIGDIEKSLPRQEYAGKVPLKADAWKDVRKRLGDRPPVFRTRYKLAENQELTFKPGGLSFVVAPSGHGKTTFLMNILADAIEDHPDKRHWLFSFEEHADQVYLKTFNAWAGEEFSKSNMDTMEYYFQHEDSDPMKYFSRGKGEVFLEKQAAYGDLVDSGRVNIKQGDFMAEDLAQGIRELAKDKPGLVLIDYAQLLYLDNPVKTMARTEELKKICLMLKDVSVETGLCIILAAQFNRQVTHASQMHMSNIADAADIERAATKILGLWNGNKADLLGEKEAKAGAEFNQAAGIMPEEEGHFHGTVFLKVLKDRAGVSELWATYTFDGNRLHIDREPVKAGRGDPKRRKGKSTKGGHDPLDIMGTGPQFGQEGYKPQRDVE